MKILYIGHESTLNGASKSLLELISALKDHHQIYVLTRYHQGPFYDELKKRKVTVLVYPYYRWCVVKNTRLGWIRKIIKWNCHQKFVNKKTASIVADIVKKEHIDLIHTNTSVINIGGMIRELCPDVRHIWHIREFADLDFGMYPLISTKKYYDFMNRTADQFIFNSKAVSKHFSRLSSEKKNIVYNGVASNNIILEENREPHDGINILISGRVHSSKGQDQAVEACERLLQRRINIFHLYIAGEVINELCISEALRDYVTILGRVDNMPELRRKIDLELVCSKAEAFGRVTVEAYLAGIPVIGSKRGGTVELIQDGVTGFLYEPGNTEMLADKIQLLIQDDVLRKQCGKNARQFAKENFMTDMCVKNICKVYQKECVMDA